jgi:hypothetical protein
MHKSATKCNETIGKWCKNKHGASKIIDMFETYQYTPQLQVLVTCKTLKQVTLGSENIIPINKQFLKCIKPFKHFD